MVVIPHHFCAGGLGVKRWISGFEGETRLDLVQDLSLESLKWRLVLSTEMNFPGRVTLDLHFKLGEGLQRSIENLRLQEDHNISELFSFSKGPAATNKIFEEVDSRTASLPWHIWAIGGQETPIPFPINSMGSIFKTLQENAEEYSKVTSITFVLMFYINIRFRGEGRLPNPKNTAVIRRPYQPSENGNFLEYLRKIYEAFKKEEVMLVDAKDDVVKDPESGVLEGDDPNGIDLYYTPTRSNYSNITVAAFFNKVRSEHRATSDWLDNATAAMDQKVAAIEAKVAKEKARSEKIPREGLLAAAASWVQQLSGERLVKWNAMIDALTLHLQKLSKGYKPREDHLEQARRLVIDAFFLNVVDFLGMELSVEIELTTSANKRSLGWGPLDYYAEQKTVAEEKPYSSLTILKAVETVSYLDKRKNEGKECATHWGTRSGLKSRVIESEDEENEEDWREQDRKRAADPTALFPARGGTTHVDTKGVAQLGSQLYDNHMRKAPPNCKVVEGKTVGVLSTGHRWLFFRLVSEKEHEKPLFEYLGEALVTVLRQNKYLPPAVKTNGFIKKRTSLKAVDDYSIDVNDVRAVAGCLAAALEGKLDVGEMTFARE